MPAPHIENAARELRQTIFQGSKDQPTIAKTIERARSTAGAKVSVHQDAIRHILPAKQLATVQPPALEC
jgi:hypothetical protein